MKNPLAKIPAFVTFLSGILPTVAHAGIPPPTVTLGPVSAVSPVPALSDGLLIALGVVLAVIALRAIREQVAYQKLLSLTLLVTGLAVGTVGVERALASGLIIIQADDLCSGATSDLPLFFGSFTPATNNCDATELEVISYNNMLCVDEDQVIDNGGVGTVFGPGDTINLNYCPTPR